MRFYSFTNMYTSGIHAGIQTAHAAHEMMLKYSDRPESDEKRVNLMTWATQHKTIIVLQAGYHSALNELYDELKPLSAMLSLPIVRWKEGKEALNGATTAIGLVLPKTVYGIKTDDLPTAGWATPEEELASIVRRYRMAI